MGWRSSSSGAPTAFARKTGSRRSSPRAVTTPAWSTSSPRWSAARLSNRGTTRRTGKTTLRGRDGKCLHYYFYFIDAEFGLCYFRVPTWAPFRLQFYCNGHNWLAGKLRQAGIACTQLDNTFLSVADFARAQELADSFPVDRLHRLLDRAASQFCPVLPRFETAYHWSLMQVEYATDLVFRRQADLRPLYDTLVRTAVHAVKAEHVATFRLSSTRDPDWG